ncbi:hypothetical protein [Micromonospora sp. WMMC273]|uniref:hypothetical protein n=1 Tax=Micromonospora sp. WMMC273 TaxID=3015157 RepID=UPI0022B61BB8|nr:hypothetical protein [Micromonospora sp. WMMC273]MCZ7478895.1 hypothetical protein [Micromonospora sp. WMMC273]
MKLTRTDLMNQLTRAYCDTKRVHMRYSAWVNALAKHRAGDPTALHRATPCNENTRRRLYDLARGLRFEINNVREEDGVELLPTGTISRLSEVTAILRAAESLMQR